MKSELLLDTNVVSETAKNRPDPAVMDFLARQDRLRVSAITVFELARGVTRLRPGKKRAFLEAWLAKLLAASDVMPFDGASALAAARIESGARAAGRSFELRDLFILATAEAAGLGVATCNVGHFRGAGVPVIDPASGEAAL